MFSQCGSPDRPPNPPEKMISGIYVSASSWFAPGADGITRVMAVPAAARARPPTVLAPSSQAIPAPVRCRPAMATPIRTRTSAAPSVISTAAAMRPAKYPQDGSGVARHRRSTPSSLAAIRLAAWVR